MFTCAEGTGIAKGTLLKIADPATVSKSTSEGDVIIGVAAAEKIASNGTTQIPVHTSGYFKAYLSGAIVAGEPLMNYYDATYQNHVHAAWPTQSLLSGGKTFGMALETGANTESIRVLLNVGGAGA